MLGAVVMLPLVHVAVETVSIVLRGDLVYDAEVDAGRGAWAGVVALWDWAHEALPWAGRAFAVSAVVLTALAFALLPVAIEVRRNADRTSTATLRE